MSPICLPESSGQNYDSVKAIVTGWGMVSRFGTVPDPNELRAVEVNTMSNRDCKILNPAYHNTLTDDELCAADPGVDACTGDSGGNQGGRNSFRYSEAFKVTYVEGDYGELKYQTVTYVLND